MGLLEERTPEIKEKGIIETEKFRLNTRVGFLDLKDDSGKVIETYKMYGVGMRKSLGLSLEDAIRTDFSLINKTFFEKQEGLLKEILEELQKNNIN